MILKAVLPGPPEEAAEAAKTLFEQWEQDRIRVVLPALWAYEVGNILHRRCPEHAGPLLDALFGLAPEVYILTPTLVERALSVVGRARGATFYDASYHALAIELGGTFVTADAAYFRLARRVGRVELLPGVGT